MHPALNSLAGAAATVAASFSLGKLFLDRIGARLHRAEYLTLAFLTGSACLSAVIFVISAVHLARKGVFLCVAGGIVFAAWRAKGGAAREPSPPMPRWLAALAIALALPFFVLYFFTALAPEVSPDGSTYHLGNVLRYWANHGLVPIRNMYGALPEGLEMLYLVGFSIGRHS